MKTKPKSLPGALQAASERTISDTSAVADSVASSCPRSHRVARQLTTAIVAILLVMLALCGAYLMWSQSL